VAFETDHVGRIQRYLQKIPPSARPEATQEIHEVIVTGAMPGKKCCRQLLASRQHASSASLRHELLQPDIDGQRPVKALVSFFHVDEQII
jgi:hypothetical protein